MYYVEVYGEQCTQRGALLTIAWKALNTNNK